MQDYDDFKVGDKVWCLMHGAGEVISITPPTRCENYPVKVKFQGTYIESYTPDGRITTGWKTRTLFFSEPKVEAAVKRPFTPTLIGKNIVINHAVVGTLMFTVTEETDEYIVNRLLRYKKEDIRSIYELGEKLK